MSTNSQVIIYYISKKKKKSQKKRGEIEKKCKGDPFIQHDYIYLFIILDLSLMLFEMFE